MNKYGYESIPELSNLFEKYTEKQGVSAWAKALDFMFTVCQIDTIEGTNKQSMTIEKLVNADDDIWGTFLREKLGLGDTGYQSNLPLPRVQKERIFLDYILWVVYVGIKDGKMPCYCCESTPKAINRATDASYKSEEELIEVYEMLYKELKLEEKFEPSLLAVNMLESAAMMIRVLSDLASDCVHSDDFKTDGWATTIYRRTNTGLFNKDKLILPNSLLDNHNSLRLLGEYVPDEEFFKGRDNLRARESFELYAKQCLSSIIHSIIRFSYTLIQKSYSANEFNANYIMNCLLSKFGDYLPVGTLSLDNVVPSVNPPVQMHIAARSKCIQVYSMGNDMCVTQSIIGLFGVICMFDLRRGNTGVTPDDIKTKLGIDRYEFWRW